MPLVAPSLFSLRRGIYSTLCRQRFSSSSLVMSSTTQNPQDGTDPNRPTEDAQSSTARLALPVAEGNSSGGNQLKVNGDDLKLDILGPVVVNADGSLSRVNNWSTMADVEKEAFKRMVLTRNAKRLASLRQAQEDS